MPKSSLKTAKQKVAKKSHVRKKNVINFVEASSKLRSTVFNVEQQNQAILEFRDKGKKLARSFMRRWRAHMEFAELDSLVDLSLCEAASRFDTSKGASFMTFLFYHLKGNLIRSISSAATSYTVPLDIVEGDEDSQDSKRYTYRSMNSIEITEALAIKDIETPSEILQKKELFEIADNACGKLDTLEQEVIHRIFLKGEKLMSVAKELGYSRCHISRVKSKAITQLQEEMEESLKIIDLKQAKTSIDFAKHRKTVRRPRVKSECLELEVA